MKKLKTLKGNGSLSWTVKGLKKYKGYKAYVKAWKMKDGKKTYVKTSLTPNVSLSLEDYQLAESGTIFYQDAAGAWKQKK